MGSVTELTDESGEVVERLRYKPFGQLKEGGGSNAFAFTGREYDRDSGLYYYRSRYYNAANGRFLQRDPLTWGPGDKRILFALPNTSITDIVRSFQNLNAHQRLLDRNLVSGRRQVTNADVESKWVKELIISSGSGFPQLQHRYNYCFNNPVNYTDPDGEEIVLWMAATAVVVIVAILAHQTAWYLGKLDKYPAPEEPGPPIQPYRPDNPFMQGPTGYLPSR